MNWTNSVMFGKNNKTLTSSDRTSVLKNKILFNNKDIQDTVLIDSNNNLSQAKSYTEYYSIYKGFLECKKTNFTSTDECQYTVWLDQEVDEMKLNNIDDYYLSKVSYYFPNTGDDFLQDSDGQINNLDWPYKINGSCVQKYTDIYSFFDEENPKCVTIYAKNLKYGLRMSKLQN